MNKVLIVFAHPRFEKSKYNRALLAGVERMENVTLNDLYERYPDFNIDTEREKKLLTEHDVVVWHFPLYMYSAPAMLKQWIDAVLEYSWAHGSRGNALAGKFIFVALTAGGARNSYAQGGHNRFTLREFLAPFEQTAVLCKMTYLPPFAVHGTYQLADHQLADHVRHYHRLLGLLIAGEFSPEAMLQHDYLNDWLIKEEGRS